MRMNRGGSAARAVTQGQRRKGIIFASRLFRIKLLQSGFPFPTKVTVTIFHFVAGFPSRFFYDAAATS